MAIRRIDIMGKSIGKGEPVYFISEIGNAFENNIETAKKMIKMSAKAGADAVKFQTFKADTIADKESLFTFENGEKVSQYEFFKQNELSEDNHYELMDLSKKEGISFISTPSHKNDVDFLEELGVCAFKVGSDDLTNYPFLKYIAKKGLPMFVSTGMSTLGEIEVAVNTIKDTGNEDLILMHCTVGYPISLENANLRIIKTLQEAFQVPVGYSDHTQGYLAPIVANMLGSVAIEKHFTLDRSHGGPDYEVAAEPGELVQIIENIRNVEKVLGSSTKKIVEQEIKWRESARKSIFAGQDIEPGTLITEEMIVIKRPSNGISPKYLELIIGRMSRKYIRKDELITWEML